MFKQMKHIDTAFRHIRGFSLLVILGCMVVAAFTVHKSFQATAESGNRIYLLVNGKAWEAFASNRQDNIPVEAKDHIKNFHDFFFTLDPDDQVIRNNITKALYLADASAEKEYENLKESGYYANIIAANISQRITVDSVRVDTNSYPYPFRCYATERIIRTTSTVTRSLVTAGYLRCVSRSDHNPHGFLIERWQILENQDIKVTHP